MFPYSHFFHSTRLFGTYRLYVSVNIFISWKWCFYHSICWLFSYSFEGINFWFYMTVILFLFNDHRIHQLPWGPSIYYVSTFSGIFDPLTVMKVCQICHILTNKLDNSLTKLTKNWLVWPATYSKLHFWKNSFIAWPMTFPVPAPTLSC